MNLRLPFRSAAAPLGIAWDRDHLHVASLVAGSTGPVKGPSTRLPWSRPDLTPEDTASAGLRLRAALAKTGLASRPCVAAVPSPWIMSVTVQLPDLSAEDLEAFVALTAERSLPYPAEELQIARSVTQLADSRRLTLLAVRKKQLTAFQNLLTAAGLKPISFTFGLPFLPEVTTSNSASSLTLFVDDERTFFLSTIDRHVGAWIALDGIDESSVKSLLRGLRIAWEQLPSALQLSLHQVQVLGPASAVAQAEPVVQKWAGRLPGKLSVNPTIIDDLGPRTALAVAHLASSPPAAAVEFLPPRPSLLQQWVTRFPLQRFGGWSAAAGAVAAVLLIALGWQAFTLWHLRSQWAEIAPAVTSTEALQENIRQFRSWSDTNPQNLAILQLVSEAFPSNGSVTAKNIEITDTSAVTITGTTTDNSALLELLDQLRLTPAVSALELAQIRGREPAQFTFKFTWKSIPGA